jgi:serine/threonine protein kinase
VLLDFNLAEDTKDGVAGDARLGGTLPYMAPEQLQGLQIGCSDNSPGSDLYSLGLILFELLTGRFPFPSCSGPTREALPKLIASRSVPPPPLCCWNRDITPAVEAIVRAAWSRPVARYRLRGSCRKTWSGSASTGRCGSPPTAACASVSSSGCVATRV